MEKRKLHMRSFIINALLLLCCAALLPAFQPSVLAQDRRSGPAAARPLPEFDHSLHEDALADDGCGVCHHVLDEQTKQLIYSEGEGGPCTECHLESEQADIPAIREANHGSCNACHRQLKKIKKPAGPTTCGECHKKQS
jgi:hypothetical protein